MCANKHTMVSRVSVRGEASPMDVKGIAESLHTGRARFKEYCDRGKVKASVVNDKSSHAPRHESKLNPTRIVAIGAFLCL